MTYEVVLDNSKMLANCFEAGPYTLDIPGYVQSIGVFTTLVGGATCISTNDGGTTYMRQHVGPVGGGTAGYNDGIRFPATDIPDDYVIESTKLVTVTKGTDSRNTGYINAVGAILRLRTNVGSSLRQWWPIFSHGAADWTEMEIDLSVDSNGQTYPITEEMIESGTVQFNSSTHATNFFDTVAASWTPGAEEFDSYWTYIALRLRLVPV